MKRGRGFKLKHRVSTLFRFVLRGNGSVSGYHRFDLETRKSKPISRLFSCLKMKAKALCSGFPGRGYVPLEKAVPVPKGQMAVYVGQKDGGDGDGYCGFHRFLVPVIYFNHPLFGELLREAEEEFGFDNPGGITIPCRVSEFERVQTRIAAGLCGRKLLTWTKTS